MARTHQSDNLNSALLVWIAAVSALAFALVIGLYQLALREAGRL